jgi:CheY-like chemotaxis protein
MTSDVRIIRSPPRPAAFRDKLAYRPDPSILGTIHRCVKSRCGNSHIAPAEEGARMLQEHADARVLVVDDYEGNVMLLKRLLARHGMTAVETVTDPRTVMARLPELDPDLVLLDLHMPHVDGYMLLKQIRAWVGEAYLPVIVLTADTTPETLLRAVDEGATDFLTKPFNATEIVIRIRNLLQTRRLYRELEALRQPAVVGPSVRGADQGGSGLPQRDQGGPGGVRRNPCGEVEQHPGVETGGDGVQGGGAHAVVGGDPDHVDRADPPGREPVAEADPVARRAFGGALEP